MNDTLISRLANCRMMVAARLRAVDVAAIDDAIAALAQPAVPEPMTREFCAAFPGTAAGIINELARQIDAAQEKP